MLLQHSYPKNQLVGFYRLRNKPIVHHLNFHIVIAHITIQLPVYISSQLNTPYLHLNPGLALIH